MLKFSKLIWILLITIALYLLFIGIVYFFQNNIIFQPTSLSKNYSFSFDAPFEEIWVTTSDNVEINALLFRTQQLRKGLVLYFHGNRGNLQRWAQYHVDFTEKGYDFLAIDYRGYGKSSGRPSEEGLYIDAKTIYERALENYSPDEIIIYGRSLGTGVASHLATKVAAQQLMLETPYNSLQGAFQTKIPFFPIPFRLRTQFPTDQNLQKISIPVTIFHGTRDGIVSIRSAKKLKPFLTKEDLFVIIPKGKHKNLASFSKFQQALSQRLN